MQTTSVATTQRAAEGPVSLAFALGPISRTCASAGEPDPKTYWDVRDIRPGMKGVGRTVMLGTKLEEFLKRNR